MQEAVFAARLSRFLCRVMLSGVPVDVHVPNTGRLLFLREGARCLLRHAAAPGRKTAWDLFATEDVGTLVCVDSLMPNRIAEEVLTADLLCLFKRTFRHGVRYAADHVQAFAAVFPGEAVQLRHFLHARPAEGLPVCNQRNLAAGGQIRARHRIAVQVCRLKIDLRAGIRRLL